MSVDLSAAVGLSFLAPWLSARKLGALLVALLEVMEVMEVTVLPISQR